MKVYFDVAFKMLVVLLLSYITYLQHLQEKQFHYRNYVTVEGGKIDAFITNDERSRIPVESKTPIKLSMQDLDNKMLTDQTMDRNISSIKQSINAVLSSQLRIEQTIYSR